MSGLQTIPSDYYEAASIDGANSWQVFRNVTGRC
ncbi:MAG: sugar ABC transporter permease [Caldilineales bacterium]|nr:sugar ABC transporter permease [Caldilineales bacterium]